MGTFTQLSDHIVFGTKYRRPTIQQQLFGRLHKYFGGIMRERKGILYEAGGTTDHIHLLAGIPPNLAVSDVVRDIKAGSSKWMNELPETTEKFEWQKGYGAFTVSYSNNPSVAEYIQRQEEHHRKLSFKEEFIAILRKHDIEFKMEYLFDGEHAA